MSANNPNLLPQTKGLLANSKKESQGAVKVNNLDDFKESLTSTDFSKEAVELISVGKL